VPPYNVTINYVYDSLYRLKEANYSDGRYFNYTYDAVGNRLSETKCLDVGGCASPTVTNYSYDSANRLTNVNGQTYQWDDNGNLLNDGTSTYVYDAANRLKSVSNQSSVSSYQYNGLGDRLSQTVNSVTTNYALDLNAGLTQVLADGTNTYLYGNGRVGELQPAGFVYHLGNALGSVRQLTDASGGVTLARSYEAYGTPLTSAGTGSSVFAYAGEQFDSYTELIYLRARWYRPETGTFQSKDAWPPDYNRPLSLHRWAYGESDPVNHTDPSGHQCSGCKTPGDWAKFTLYYGYGITMAATFADDEKVLILETVDDFAELLGGMAAFRRNVALSKIDDGWETERFAAYYPTNRTIIMDKQWYYPAIGQRPGSSRFEIGLCQPDIEEMLSFPEGSLPSAEIQAKFVLAHEMGHAFASGNYSAFKDFTENVDIPWAAFGWLDSNHIFRRNSLRDADFRQEVFADVIAAYLYAPSVLNQDMTGWLQTNLPRTLK